MTPSMVNLLYMAIFRQGATPRPVRPSKLMTESRSLIDYCQESVRPPAVARLIQKALQESGSAPNLFGKLFFWPMLWICLTMQAGHPR